MSLYQPGKQIWLIASVYNNSKLWLLSAYNRLSEIPDIYQGSLNTGHVVTTDCGPCILYSGYLHATPDNSVIVLADNVFGKVLSWDSGSGDVINSVDGLLHCTAVHW